jgi:hypothetical protein
MTREETMTTTTLNLTDTRMATERDTGMTARVAVLWAVAGGILAGGFLVAAMTLAERLNGNALLLTAGGLYILGAVLGFANGAVLGFFGRPDDVKPGEAVRKLGFAALYAVPALALGFLVAGWIAMTVMAMYAGHTAALAAMAAGWLIGAVLVAWAVLEGWAAMHNLVVAVGRRIR